MSISKIKTNLKFLDRDAYALLDHSFKKCSKYLDDVYSGEIKVKDARSKKSFVMLDIASSICLRVGKLNKLVGNLEKRFNKIKT